MPTDPREFDLAVREAELKRREEALKQAEKDRSLPRVPADYFGAGSSSDERDWWAKQLGNEPDAA